MIAYFKRMRNQTRLLQAYKDVFYNGESAKLVLEDLIDVSGWSEGSYEQGMDSSAVAFREGRKAVINHILACMHYDEDYIGRINVLLEAKERRIARLNQYQEY